ncbi:MAG: hypothetical protein GF364_14440, partial [Candidatus Lokiarchaeota archaeon]|nr:hypothetical protein [Candidatus Lokiarchaeota archaeon]
MIETENKDNRTYNQYLAYFKEYLGFPSLSKFQKQHVEEVTKSLEKKLKNYQRSLAKLRRIISIDKADFDIKFIKNLLNKLGITVDKFIKNNQIFRRKDLAKILYAKKKITKNNLFRALLAKECLLSFFSNRLRQEPLIEAMVVKRLIHGTKPLKTREKQALNFYWNIKRPELEKNMVKNVLFQQYQYLDKIALPKSNLEEAFKIHTINLAQHNQFLTDGDPELIDAILDDGFFTWTKKATIKPDLMKFIFYINELFNQKKIPFSIDYVRDKLVEDEEKNVLINRKWIDNPEIIQEYWNEMNRQSISFA